MHVMEVRTPSASAAPSLSILASVRMQVADRVNGGHSTFAVSSCINFTKKQIFCGCSTVKHFNSFLLYKAIGIYYKFITSSAISYILCCFLFFPRQTCFARWSLAWDSTDFGGVGDMTCDF